MCSERTAFNLEGEVQGSHVLWKENWKLESVKVVSTKLMTFNHLISKVSLKFNMLKPTYIFKIILNFVRFFFTMISKHKSGIFLPTGNYYVGVKSVYILFQNYVPETSFVVQKLKSLVKRLGFQSDFPTEAKGLHPWTLQPPKVYLNQFIICKPFILLFSIRSLVI